MAGNPIDSFLVQTKVFDGTAFVPVTLNGIPTTGLLGQEALQTILRTGRSDIADPAIDEQLFIAKAEHINEILHLGAVNPHQRAGVMAALLLAQVSDTAPNIDEPRPDILIRDINARVHSILRDQGKSEFADYINIALPSTPDNHIKLRQALVDTLQELNNLNIRSAMNSGADWLGAFYEVFLKYASWAQDLGIVLTPRHLTRWAADVLDIQVNDIVYDPTCGTGGFLVAAFDYVKQNASPTQLERFKQHSVFGIEQDDGVAALAVVNMIFRGDGKNNIQEGNCFARHLTAGLGGGSTHSQIRYGGLWSHPCHESDDEPSLCPTTQRRKGIPLHRPSPRTDGTGWDFVFRLALLCHGQARRLSSMAAPFSTGRAYSVRCGDFPARCFLSSRRDHGWRVHP